jgi:hypothetical protein
MRVLLTGATGYIADQLLPAFRERYDLRLLDVREEDRSDRHVEGIEVADLLDDDRSKLEPYFSNTEVVVHTGHRRPIGTDPANGTAQAPADYTATNGTLTFDPGETTKTVAVPIKSDRRKERNETFFVNLSGANTTIADARGKETILDND